VFARCEWFGQDVLWLAPEPDDPFRELIDAVWRSFPQHPPYGGAPGAPIPHLTVGERKLGTVRALRGAATAVSAVLPVRARVDRALLIAVPANLAPGAPFTSSRWEQRGPSASQRHQGPQCVAWGRFPSPQGNGVPARSRFVDASPA